jgi:hypothetical protein
VLAAVNSTRLHEVFKLRGFPDSRGCPPLCGLKARHHEGTRSTSATDFKSISFYFVCALYLALQPEAKQLPLVAVPGVLALSAEILTSSVKAISCFASSTGARAKRYAS